MNLVADVYVRNTRDMLTEGVALPGVYGANSPEMNAADMQTKGYEISLNWRDQLQLASRPFSYNVGLVLSDYKSTITKYDNPNKTFAKQYYEGMELGEIWGFVTDGLFASDEEAKAYAQEVDLSYSSGRLTGGWMSGDVKFVDLDGDGIWGIGQNTVDNPGDRKILGNSLPTLSYGVNAGFDWMGFDATVILQGTGNPESDYLMLFATPDANVDEYILAIKFDYALGIRNNASGYALLTSQGRPGLTRKFVNSYLMNDGSRFTDQEGWETMTFSEETGRVRRTWICRCSALLRCC